MRPQPATRCREFHAALLIRALGGAGQQQRIDAHLQCCARCRRRAALLRRIGGLLLISPPIVAPAASLGGRLARLRALQHAGGSIDAGASPLSPRPPEG
jgi:hypothetical protein